MRNNNKKEIAKLSVVLILTTIIITAFSINLGIIPALGGILFPGNGLWKVQTEVPVVETIHIPNMAGNIEVIRDEWGIPHIYAENEGSLSFALGYVHAQDRMFQMDMARRSVRGKLSEIPGIVAQVGLEAVLNQDKYELATGKEYWANQSLQEALRMQNEGEIDFLDDWLKYAEGVNYYIDTHKNNYPMEYYILGFQPEHWEVLDSFCFMKYMSDMLTWDTNDLTRLIKWDLINSNSEISAWWDEIYDPSYPYEIPIVPEYGDYSDPPVPSDLEEDRMVDPIVLDTIAKYLGDLTEIKPEKEIMDIDKPIGSNNWAVNGSKTESGMPIFCNDMHLAQDLPGIWYEAHLIAADTGLNTYGFTLAGVPLPIVGHNNHVAWGMTNTDFDVMDWYYFEEINETHYIYNNTVTEYTFRTYDFSDRGASPSEFNVKETVHGPVLNDFIGVPNVLDEENIVLSPKWTANNITYEFMAINGFNHARNRSEFDEASKYFHTPGQNIAYADIHGNIAIRPTGLVPIRDDSKIPAEYLGNGSLPYNGSAGEGEWVGYIPFEELPNSLNPEQGYVASANQVLVGPNYTGYYMHTYKGDGYRARRINEVLSSSDTIDVQFMKDLLFDFNSTLAAEITPFLIDAIENHYTGEVPDVIEGVLNELSSWDYIMDKDLAAPTIYRVWREDLRAATFGDESEKYGVSFYARYHILENLMKQNSTSHWFDDVSTMGVVEDRNDIILKALNMTIDFLIDFYETEEADSWIYGQIHQVKFRHLIGLKDVGPFPFSGESITVNPTGVNIRNGVGYTRSGASERMIVDFSDLNNSMSCIPSGQRAVVSSKHYSDQLEKLFLTGELHVQYFTNTAENFPESEIESRIHFIGGA